MTPSGVSSVKRNWKDFFFIKISNFKHWKMSKLLNLGFPEGLNFSIVTILNKKDPLKQFYLVSERHRWVVMGVNLG